MVKFKIYPAKLYVDTKFEISNALKSVEICTTIGEKLANLYNGKFVYEGDGSESFQYSNTLIFEKLSEIDQKMIENNFPFIIKLI